MKQVCGIHNPDTFTVRTRRKLSERNSTKLLPNRKTIFDTKYNEKTNRRKLKKMIIIWF